MTFLAQLTLFYSLGPWYPATISVAYVFVLKSDQNQEVRGLYQNFFFYISQFICNLYTYIQIQSANCVLRSEGG
jgi:hypothetical protein